MLSFDTILASMTLFAAPFLRLSAMMAVAPVFSAAGFNVRTRALFAVLIAALVAPSLPAPPVDNLLSGAGVLMGIREIGVGLVLGFIVQMAFGAAVFAGQAISMTMGLGFAMAVDPQNGVQVPVVFAAVRDLGNTSFLGSRWPFASDCRGGGVLSTHPHRGGRSACIEFVSRGRLRNDGFCWRHSPRITGIDSIVTHQRRVWHCYADCATA